MIDLSGKIGNYRIVKKLGSGGFGTVYLAEDTLLEALRAVKIPHKLGFKKDSILNESKFQTQLLSHPNIVKLLTVDDKAIENNIIMVMEYVKGDDLEKILDKENKLEITKALKYFRQLLSALDFAHNLKIIHRDIRPSNIMIDEKDNVKITDFGTSKLLKEKPFATTKIGSPPYMAPEQFEGKAVYASDIYSAGCLFYEMVTGLPPVVLANPLEIYKKSKTMDFPPLIKKNSAINTRLNWIIMKTLAPELANRYKTAGEVLDDLDAINNQEKSNNREIKDIKKRISARGERLDYICSHCHKTMPQKLSHCIYCGAEQ